jgi:hypothetical protein
MRGRIVNLEPGYGLLVEDRVRLTGVIRLNRVGVVGRRRPLADVVLRPGGDRD